MGSFPIDDCGNVSLSLEQGKCFPWVLISMLNTGGLAGFLCLAISYWITMLNNTNNRLYRHNITTILITILFLISYTSSFHQNAPELVRRKTADSRLNLLDETHQWSCAVLFLDLSRLLEKKICTGSSKVFNRPKHLLKCRETNMMGLVQQQMKAR